MTSITGLFDEALDERRSWCSATTVGLLDLERASANRSPLRDSTPSDWTFTAAFADE